MNEAVCRAVAVRQPYGSYCVFPQNRCPNNNESATTIPFCRKSVALNRKCGGKRKSEALSRERRIAKRKPEPARAEGNGIVDLPQGQGKTEKRPSRYIPRALASPRFRLAGCCSPFSRWRRGSERRFLFRNGVVAKRNGGVSFGALCALAGLLDYVIACPGGFAHIR